MTIAKSPASPVVSFLYDISESGIELDTSSEDILHTENYWEAKILTKTSSAPGMRTESQHTLARQGQFFYPAPQPKNQQFPMTADQLSKET